MLFGSNLDTVVFTEPKSVYKIAIENSELTKYLNNFYQELQKLYTVPPSYIWPTVTYPISGKAVKTKMPNKPKTQKAMGVMYGLEDLFQYHLRKEYFGLTRFVKRAKHSLIGREEDIQWNGKLPCFARPCPKKPRHGFVESKVVKSNDELLKMWKEARKIDPAAEIVLGPYSPSVKYNAVYVNSGSLSIGKGNDGATGGKDAISFPVAPHKFKDSFIKKSGLLKKDAVYLESIYRPDIDYDRKWLLTQARGGPKLNAVSSDFIPKKMKVKKIVEPHDDLVRWEKEVSKFKPGTVVYGAGHTLASHAAIHCVLNKVPFVTSERPEIGSILTPKGNEEVKLGRLDFRRGVRAAVNICKMFKYEDLLRYFYYSLSVIHNWAYLKQSPHAAWLLGTAATVYCKVGTALVCGEFRHKHKSDQSRETVYKKSMRDGMESQKKLPDILEDFYDGYWTSGFGGMPWATCAWYMYALWSEITKTFNKNTATLNDKEIIGVMGLMNRATNAAHNNGWWFNKFACKDDMDFVARHPGLAAYFVADVFYEMHKRAQVVKAVKQKLTKLRRVYAPCGTTKDGRLAWLYIYSIGKITQFSLMLENGTTKYKNIKLTPDEYKGLRRKYQREDKDPYGDKTYIRIKSNGKFRLPGGKDRDLGKVFQAA